VRFIAQILVFKLIRKLAVSISGIWSIHLKAAEVTKFEVKPSCTFIVH